jgi:hypothetical protein
MVRGKVVMLFTHHYADYCATGIEKEPKALLSTIGNGVSLLISFKVGSLEKVFFFESFTWREDIP